MQGLNLSRWAVSRPTLILFLMLVIGLGGLMSYQRLGRAEDPSFTIKVGIVTAFWPGATAKETRDQVADLLEKKLQELPFLDRIETYTKPGFLAITVTFKDTTPPRDVPGLFYQLRKKLHDVEGYLPQGVKGPFVNDEYGDVDSVLYAVSGDGADYHQLNQVVEVLRQRLLSTPDAVKVNVYGDQDRKIFVEFSQAKLANLGIAPQAIFNSVAKQNAVDDAGVFETSSARVRLQVTDSLQGVEAISALPIPAGGQVLRLGDIATISAGYEDPPNFVARHNGAPAIIVGAVMARGGNVLTFGKNLALAVDEVRAKTPIGIEIEQIANQPRVVEEAVGEFTRSFVEALVIVLLGELRSRWAARTGIVVALSVPLVLAIVFIFMNILGVDLQRISLGALIIALGLMVDDAIIAVEMMMVKMEQGVRPRQSRDFRLEIDGLPDAYGRVDHGGGVHAGRLRQFLDRRIRRFDVLGAGDRAHRFVVRRGDFHALSRGEAVARFRQAASASRPRRNLSLALIRKTAAGDRLERRPSRRGSSRRRSAVFVLAALGFTHVQKQFFPMSERPELFFQLRMPEGSRHRRFAGGGETGRGSAEGRRRRGLLTRAISARGRRVSGSE